MTTPKLNEALAAFQANLPEVAKEATGNWGKYADLADVAKAVLPVLGGHGLAWSTLPLMDEEGRPVLDYALLHGSGEERGGRFPLYLFLPERATSQTGGGAVTYWRRYLLLAATGVHPHGEDDDGHEASKQPPAEQPRRRPPARDHSGEMPWDVPMANPGGHNRLAEINKKLNALGVTDRGVKLGYIQTLVGRAMDGPTDLAQDEQRDLVALLETCNTRDDLDQLRDKAVEAKA